MILVAVHYFVIFINKKDSTIFTHVDTLEKFPFVDLKDQGAIYVIRTSYPTNGPFFSQRHKFFVIEAEAEIMSSELLYPGAFPYEPRRIKLPMVPCNQLTVDLTSVNYSPIDFEDALCVQFTSSHILGGTHKDGLIKFVSFYFRPCTKTSPADTVTCNLIAQDALGNIVNVDLDPTPNPANPFDVAVLTAAGTATAYYQAFLQDFSVSFGQIDDSPGFEEFDKPLIRNLVFRDNIKLDATFVNEYRFIISELHVDTESGWLKKQTEQAKGLRQEAEGFSLKAREFFDVKINSYDINGVLQAPGPVKLEMLFIQIYISNKVSKVQRIYTTFFDYLGNLGGVYEIMITAFTILVQFHAGIEMHLYLLNKIALQDEFHEEEEPAEVSELGDLDVASKFAKTHRFVYSEIIWLKYFSCCAKDKKRYKEFAYYTRIAKHKLDLKNLIINQANTSTLASVLMKPYQTKIASKLGELAKEEEIEHHRQQQQIKLNQAVVKLVFNPATPDEDDAGIIKSKIEGELTKMIKGDDDIGYKKGRTVKARSQIKKLDMASGEEKDGESSDPLKPKSKFINPPFDPFGLTPEFYIRGDTRTTSWLGCGCTVIQILITIAVVIIYSVSFFNKEEAKVNVLNVKQKDVPFIDLHAKKILFILNHSATFIPPGIIFPISVFYVVRNTQTKIETRTQLLTKNCADVKMDLTELSESIEPGQIVPFQECLEFESATPIGFDSATHTKKYITAEFWPCVSNCFRYSFNFPAGHPFELLGQNFEINPNNILFDGGLLYR